jgi:hypothetical protein
VRRCWALTAAVLLSGCLGGEDSGGTWSLASASEVLSVTREPATPPPLVHVELELSEHAIEYFVALGLRLVVSSGQGLEGQGMLLAWSGDEGGEPARASFDGPLSSRLTSHLALTSVPCAAVPCRLTLELLPRGDWASDVSFAVEYLVDAELRIEQGRNAQSTDVHLSLELVP